MNRLLEKKIIEYENIYEINNLGIIKNKITNKILKYKLHNKGYFSINLYKNKTSKTYLIHRLIAIHFIPNPNNYPCVNHIDGNKLNNNLENLEWCSYKENNQHAYNTGLKKMSDYNKAILSKKVINNDTKVIYNSIKEVADLYNINYVTLCFKLNGSSKNNTNFKLYTNE